jgi:hypothetical protein
VKRKLSQVCGTPTAGVVPGGCHWKRNLEITQMANKRKSTKKRDPNQITSAATPDEDRAVAVARAVLRPTVQASTTLQQYGKYYGELDVSGMVGCLTEQTSAVIDGDLTRGEAMLTAQAHTLDAIFNTLARQASKAEYMESQDRYLKLALRAQSQCRATWEALATIKNPPMVGYVKQGNIAHGHQQVNNAQSSAREAPRARENESSQDKLLEEKDGERVDTGTTGKTGRADPAMATLGEIDWAEDAGG